MTTDTTRATGSTGGILGRPSARRPRRLRRAIAAATCIAVGVGMLPALAAVAPAQAAPVGEGFTVSPADLAYILQQIKIAEHHVAATTAATGPCGALVGTGPDQIANPLLSLGLRTVDGTCNNLQPGQETYGAADVPFPRLTTPLFRDAEAQPPEFGPSSGITSYQQTAGLVFDSQPRTISNLIVDQTSTNPAAVRAAGFPVRTQGNEGVFPCDANNQPVGCVPAGETLFIPNVTTDVGLSPPFNSLFTLFGQFFDHGVDFTSKGGNGTVFVPLHDDDPLVTLGPDHVANTGDEVPPGQRFMVLTRATQNADRNATNRDTPFVDQSQTYTSHSSHQVFLREYVNNSQGRPVSTGRLLGSADGGMATWAITKAQARDLLGLELVDRDVFNVPMIAADAYGKFIPGPARGLPQYVTQTGLVEGDRANPVPAPANVRRIDTAFLDDIAHNAVPSTGLVADSDTGITGAHGVQEPGTYDDEMLNAHLIAGDGRVNENIGLSAVHQIFHSEHDRLVGYIKNVLLTDTSGVTTLSDWQTALGAADADGTWNGERLFQAARFVTEMEYQHLVFEEFARKVQPAINPFQPFAFTQTDLDPAVVAEFAHAVYRFGHSMLTDTIDRTNEDGSSNPISLLDGFLNPPEYTNGGSAGTLTSEQAAGAILMGMSDQAGNEIDEFVTETLRNNLLGLPLDLASINMTRARSEGIAPLNIVRRQLYGATNDGQLKPYHDWIEFGQNLKHPESLINFVAAYGTHPSVAGETTMAGKREAARIIVDPQPGDVRPADADDFLNSVGAWARNGVDNVTGLDSVDLWVGGLAENTNLFGGLLGSTFNYVFEYQMTQLQNDDRLYYLARTPGMNLRAQLEGNSFSELVMRNTTAHSLKADPFATADCKFELGSNPGIAAPVNGNTVTDDPNSECNETAVLIRMADGTIRYRSINTVDPPGINGQSVYNGTAGVDRIYGGNDNDTFWGNEGNDRIEGGGGDDVVLGGDGNDIITDFGGFDVPKGGPGNDAIDGGINDDIVMGGDGHDFTNGGANINETFSGAGDDFAIAGQGEDAVFGDSGDDWMEGGDMPDLLQGDSGSLMFDDHNLPGNDIIIGQAGDDDYDMEGGDDIGVGGPGIEKNAGSAGYDWIIGLGDPQPQDQDLALPLVGIPLGVNAVRDRFNEVEALSGWRFDDVLRGDDVVPSQVGGGGFIGCDALDQDGLDRISGLDALVPDLTVDPAPIRAAASTNHCMLAGNVWGEGNILLGGGGSDLIEGRQADDIIDGDAYVNVRLSVRTNRANPASEIGSTDLMENVARSGSFGPGTAGMTLQEAVFAGRLDPGNIVAVREVLYDSTGTDTALFSGTADSVTVTTVPAGASLGDPGSTTTVVGPDGTDTLRNIEALAFAGAPTVAVVPPSAPVIGTAVAGVASATANWTPGADGGSPITGFTVQVLDANNNLVGPLRSAPADATSLTVTGLTVGQPVRFRVRQTTAIGTSPLSAPSNAVTPTAVPAVTEPAAPTIGTATAGNGQATVTWTPGANGGSAITGFEVRVTNAANAQVGALRAAPAGSTSLVVTGLANGTTYRFEVRALNAIGPSAFSALSNAVTPVSPVGAVPNAPTIRNARSGVPGGATTATANWRAPRVVGSAPLLHYVVTARNVGTGVLTVSDPQPAVARDQALEMALPAGNYVFSVVAVNAVGASAPSADSNQVISR